MTTRQSAGATAMEVGAIAEATLHDLLQIWLANTNSPEPANLRPDSQKIDLLVTLPSLWSGQSGTTIPIQVKSTSKSPSPSIVHGMVSPCLKYRISKKDRDSLKEAALGHDRFYVALAINRRDLRPGSLLQLSPESRFEWYIVDFTQQVRLVPEASFIYFPIQNTLNLSQFSLLWSSIWTQKFFSVLTRPELIEVPELQKLIPRIYSTGRHLDGDFYEDWTFLTSFLPQFESRLDKDVYSDLSFKLGLGHALGIISTKIYARSDVIDEINTYCPESLFGTANLWLFARSYRRFMEASGEVVPISHGHTNLRLLPLPGPADQISPLMKACLWHVALLYARLGVEVKLVLPPDADAGKDHSYYGGGIGYFPWISLSDDGMSWMIEENRAVTSGEHLDFLKQHAEGEFMSLSSTSLAASAAQLGLDQEDLRTPLDCPEMLYPAQGPFVQYPFWIYGAGLSKALNLIHTLKGKS